jgi:urease accessory protein
VSTSTSTPDRLAAEVVIRAEAAGARTVIRELTGTQPWHPRPLVRRGRCAAVALVATRASLVAGDEIRLSVAVGPGAALELVDIGATLAHHVRGGPQATVSVSLTVAAGGALIWLGRPLIAAAGCDAVRAVTADVGAGGRLLLGDAIVLGRAREQAGALLARTRITHAGRPLIDETLDTRDREAIGSPVVMGSGRVLRSLALVGVVDDVLPDGALRTHGPGMLLRSIGPDEHAAAAVAARWRPLTLAAADGP